MTIPDAMHYKMLIGVNNYKLFSGVLYASKILYFIHCVYLVGNFIRLSVKYGRRCGSTIVGDGGNDFIVVPMGVVDGGS